MRLFLLLPLLWLAPASFASEPLAELSTKVDAYLRNALEKGRFVGLSVAIVDATGKAWTRHYGHRNLETKDAPNDRTRYEIGSISKTFTRLLLAIEKAPLDSPLSRWLPSGITVPKVRGQEIRLRDLALHTGFLASVPCLPGKDNAVICYGADPDPSFRDPYRNVTRARLFEFVDAYAKWLATLPQESLPVPGAFYAYSNAGAGLLGELLALHKKTTFSRLTRSEILKPLAMHDTCFGEFCLGLSKVYKRTGSQTAWMATPRWTMPGMVGAGGMRSSLFDMTRYLKAEMGVRPAGVADADWAKLKAAIERSQVRLPTAEKELAANLCAKDAPAGTLCNRSPQRLHVGWPADLDGRAFFHAGGTGGSTSLIGFSQDKKLGVVILSNSSDTQATPPRHFPNEAGACVFQLAGRPLAKQEFCNP